MKGAAVVLLLFGSTLIVASATAFDDARAIGQEDGAPRPDGPQGSSERDPRGPGEEHPLPPVEVIQNLDLFESFPLLKDLDLFTQPDRAEGGNKKCLSASPSPSKDCPERAP